MEKTVLDKKATTVAQALKRWEKTSG